MPDSHYDGDERARGSLGHGMREDELNLAIRRRSDGEAAGWVELRWPAMRPKCPTTSPPSCADGHRRRALEAFLAWAAQQIGLRRARLACHTDNLASRRVAEKCGFVLLGQQGEECPVPAGPRPGRAADLVLRALQRSSAAPLPLPR